MEEEREEATQQGNELGEKNRKQEMQTEMVELPRRNVVSIMMASIRKIRHSQYHRVVKTRLWERTNFDSAGIFDKI